MVPDGQALAKAREIAERIAANGPLAVAAILRRCGRPRRCPRTEAFAIEGKLGMEVMSSNDAAEGPAPSSRSAHRLHRDLTAGLRAARSTDPVA